MKSLLSVFTAFCVAITLAGCGGGASTTTPEADSSTPATEHAEHAEGGDHAHEGEGEAEGEGAAEGEGGAEGEGEAPAENE